MTLRPARPCLVDGVMAGLVYALASLLIGLIAFDWHLDDALLGAAIGTAGFALVDWWFETSAAVPTPEARLPGLPADAAVETPADARRWWRWLVLPAAGVAAGWALSDYSDVASAVFVPGQMLGYALSNLLALGLVARWERRHGRRVLLSTPESTVRLYAE